MCGIAGWVDAAGGEHIDQVGAMMSVVQHRGPDGEGIFSSPGVTLGHRRLSVIDLRPTASQPMTRGELALTYNGEIYNYIELRAELEMLGHCFTTDSDTEVLLAAYAEWGTECVRRFDGMWAFALFDAATHRLFCSRDRFGEKPFTYWWDGERFVFGSEARQLRAVGLGTQADLDAVRQFITIGTLVSPDTSYFEGLSNLPAATNLVVDCRTLKMDFTRYYEVGESGLFQDIGRSQFPDALEAEFDRSVTNRLRSDVQVGMLLSGGVDSSLIAMVAGPKYRAMTGAPLVAVTAASGDPMNDESALAATVARRADLHWQAVPVSGNLTRKSWAEATRIIEQPMVSSSHVMQMQVMQRARELGCTVLLDGQGADESWMGYPRYVFPALRELPLSQRVKFMVQSSSRTGLGVSRWLAHWAYFRSPTLATARTRRRLAPLGLELDTADFKSDFSERIGSGGRSIHELQKSQLVGEQLAALLRYADRTSMHYSIEDRLPYLDYRLVELSAVVPTDMRFTGGWTKWLLRQRLAKDVDPAIAWRKGKIGFEPARSIFDPRHEGSECIRASRCLEDLGVDTMRLEDVSPVLVWRLFAIATWEQECLR